MKIEVVDNRIPELKPGQLWKRSNGEIYLAIKAGPNRNIELVPTKSFASRWADSGFGYVNTEGWTYLGELKVTP